jgi:LmbE family N-acetylglucosaminyl deacetylase
MRWIYLSPHLDDAALCAGGLIYDQYQAGEVVEIWTLMSGIPEAAGLTPYAQVMHARWSTTTAEQTVKLRRAEDLRASEILGARTAHLGFLDAIYRTTTQGEPLYDDPVGAAVHPADAALVLNITRELERRLRGDETVVTLLGFGDHADHVIVRQAAEATGCSLQYVADFPYVVKYPDTIAHRVDGMASDVRAVSEAGVANWIAAVEAYGSQLKAVFEEASPVELIRVYWEPLQGIRLWTSARAAAAPHASAPGN